MSLSNIISLNCILQFSDLVLLLVCKECYNPNNSYYWMSDLLTFSITGYHRAQRRVILTPMGTVLSQVHGVMIEGSMEKFSFVYLHTMKKLVRNLAVIIHLLVFLLSVSSLIECLSCHFRGNTSWSLKVLVSWHRVEERDGRWSF